jgi:hypothetical protein
MTSVGFECVHCRHRLLVRADRVGKAVRCPNCQTVLIVPSSAQPDPGELVQTPLTAPGMRRPPSKPQELDSIFSDEDEDESLFGGLSEVRKPILPPSLTDSPQPTVRVPGIADAPTGAKPAAERFPDVPPVVVVPPAAVAPAEGTNLFRRMVDEVLTEAEERADEDEFEPDAAADAPGGSSRWLKWAFVGVSVYAVAATAAAVWGWTRAPAERPGVQVPKK